MRLGLYVEYLCWLVYDDNVLLLIRFTYDVDQRVMLLYLFSFLGIGLSKISILLPKLISA